MEKVYSKVIPNKLLYAIVRLSDIGDYRLDMSPDEEFLQLSARSLRIGTIVPAHRHLTVDRVTNITQEAWLVFKGKIEGTFYDLDNKLIETVILTDGDCVILFRGGHKLSVLEENTIFYELKTGPYYGKIADKEPIE
jgi:cupin fold WbuC family metalloprotein